MLHRRTMHRFSLWLVATVALSACRETPPTPPAPDPATTTQTGAARLPSTATATATHAASPGVAVGTPAPDFTLVDLDGKTHHLADYRGKRVVIEWFNPDCPFVRASHTKGSLRDHAKRATSQGVVWLAINSSAAGKQGSGPDTNRQGKERYGLTHPILFDPDGKVGHAYGATNTPHMFVLDERGTVVYRGAIDNSPDGEGESPTGGKLVNHVEAALADLAAGRPVQTPETRAYGCSVKYAAM